MRAPWGRAVKREMLERAPSLDHAIELMPSPPPPNSDIELVRAWERAMRRWLSGPLWLAKVRHQEGLDEAIPPLERGSDPRADQHEQEACRRLPQAGGPERPRGGTRTAQAAASAVHRRRLTMQEVCDRAGVTAAVVNRAVFMTRQGLSSPGDPNHLPRAMRTRAGFRLSDVDIWIEARDRIERAGRVANA